LTGGDLYLKFIVTAAGKLGLPDNDVFRGELIMGWRGKTFVLLIVYIAGFATAGYLAEPVSGRVTDERGRFDAGGVENFATSKFNSRDIAPLVNAGLQKCLRLGKHAAGQISKIVREKIAERRQKSEKQTE